MIPITQNAVLQPLSASDASALFDVIEANRPMLEQYLYWAASVRSVGDTRAYIETRLHSEAAGSAWYGIWFQSQIAGVLGVKSMNPEAAQVEMGYWLGAQAQGQGIVSRAVTTVANAYCHERKIKTLVLHCLAENQASMAVAQRLGGHWVEVVKDFYELDGSVQDLHIAHVPLPIAFA